MVLTFLYSLFLGNSQLVFSLNQQIQLRGQMRAVDIFVLEPRCIGTNDLGRRRRHIRSSTPRQQRKLSNYKDSSWGFSCHVVSPRTGTPSGAMQVPTPVHRGERPRATPPSHPLPRRVRPELQTPPPHRPQPCSSSPPRTPCASSPHELDATAQARVPHRHRTLWCVWRHVARHRVHRHSPEVPLAQRAR